MHIANIDVVSKWVSLSEFLFCGFKQVLNVTAFVIHCCVLAHIMVTFIRPVLGSLAIF